jgi:hypothetical protein
LLREKRRQITYLLVHGAPRYEKRLVFFYLGIYVICADVMHAFQHKLERTDPRIEEFLVA